MVFALKKNIRALFAPCMVLGCGILSGCGGDLEVQGPPPVRPVKIFTVAGSGSDALRRFPGTIDASQRADVGFRVGGRLQKLLVAEGDSVSEGDVLAELDPTDFNIVLQDRQATFDNAEQNFTRAKELIVDGNISRMDYDRMEANFRTSRAALTQARQDLEYTQLRAPFSGRIAQRDVENFEEVLAKQTVFRLQNVAELDVRIDMPESLVRSFRGNREHDIHSPSESRDEIKAYAQFEGRPNSRFDLQIKEVATKADAQTQTFRVTFTMPSPKDFTVLPGMTANVAVDFGAMIESEAVKWVPVHAVQADSGLEPRVWVLDSDSMTVSSHPVTIGRMSGNRIEVSSGLKGGEEIVTVGAHYLAEGMSVTRMKLTEQAVPRADDPA
jgi:RND family efflux transporter MFP subunit